MPTEVRISLVGLVNDRDRMESTVGQLLTAVSIGREATTNPRTRLVESIGARMKRGRADGYLTHVSTHQGYSALVPEAAEIVERVRSLLIDPELKRQVREAGRELTVTLDPSGLDEHGLPRLAKAHPLSPEMQMLEQDREEALHQIEGDATTVDPYLVDRLYAAATVGGADPDYSRTFVIDMAAADAAQRRIARAGARARALGRPVVSPQPVVRPVDRARAAQRWDENRIADERAQRGPVR